MQDGYVKADYDDAVSMLNTKTLHMPSFCPIHASSKKNQFLILILIPKQNTHKKEKGKLTTMGCREIPVK